MDCDLVPREPERRRTDMCSFQIVEEGRFDNVSRSLGSDSAWSCRW